ncbi:MAG: hypothetical protein AAGA60_04020 [Cyanobacteria bacterium P01_E01_bin.42]
MRSTISMGEVGTSACVAIAIQFPLSTINCLAIAAIVNRVCVR